MVWTTLRAHLAALLVMTAAGAAHGDTFLTEYFRDGIWSWEAAVTAGTYSGKAAREGDLFVVGVVDYSWPIQSRVRLALRGYPVFVYYEDDDGHGSDSIILGVGAGLGLRVYARKDVYTGWYGEMCLSPIYHSRYLEENSSRVNFLVELGLGYQWENRWHAAMKWEHMSNGSLGNNNSGVNGVAVVVGRRF